MVTKTQAAIGSLALAALASTAGCSLDYYPARDARERFFRQSQRESEYFAQRTPESSYSPATISGEVYDIDTCEDSMRACIGVITVDNVAYKVMIDSACRNILDVLKEGDKVVVEEALRTESPGEFYASGCGVEILE